MKCNKSRLLTCEGKIALDVECNDFLSFTLLCEIKEKYLDESE